MDRERWRVVERLFLELMDANSADRAELLLERSGGDRELAVAVESLLEAHDRCSGLTVGAEVEIAAPDASEAVIDDRLGERLGVYELVEEIGRGGMATVYRARRTDDAFERDVAIKILRAPLEDRELRARFRAERQILAGLEHPSIARLYDGGVTDDRALYLVLELVEGQPIDAYCEERQCDLSERLRLFRQACEAVAFAHQRLVVHRDLKPSNILVDSEGQVRLLDFGIAKLLNPQSPLSTLTGADLTPLTPRFASPEQLRGEQVTTASDVFSLGALLYLLTAGRPAFADSLVDRLREIVLDEQPPRPSEVLPGAEHSPGLRNELRGDLDAIVQKAIRGRREDRYQTVQELAADLERARAGEPVLARQGSWAYLSGRWIRRNRMQVVAATLLLTLIALWAWSARWQTIEIARQRDLARSEASKAAETSEFMVALFDSAAPGRAEDAGITARELLDRGAERAREDLATQPEVQATMLLTIGRSLAHLGLSSEAVALLEEALAVHLRSGAGDDTIGRVLVEIAIAKSFLDEYPEAAAIARESIALCRLSAEESPRCLADGLRVLGGALAATGDLPGAREILEEGLLLVERVYGADHANTAAVFSTFGMVTYMQTDWGQAVRYLSRARQIWQGSRERDDAEVARNTNILGRALRMVGRADEAVLLHREAHEILVEMFGPVHLNVAGSLGSLGMAQLALADAQGAEQSVRKGIEMMHQLLAPGHKRLFFVQADLAQVLAQQGRSEEAERLFAEAIAGMRLTVPGSFQRAQPLAAFAFFLMEQDRFAEAKVFLDEALEVAAPLPPGIESVRRIVEAVAECERALGVGATGPSG